jgi:RNA polymerase sigma-70 factor (ECF subfamily)
MTNCCPPAFAAKVILSRIIYKNFIPRQENLTEQTVEFNELLAAIEKRMEYLPEKSKKVFRLNRLEGHSITEIANALNLSEKAIEYHLTRSLKELRLHLKDFIISFVIWFSLPF